MNWCWKLKKAGLPQNSCAWVKGLYTTAQKYNLDLIACVREGDCSQNIALEDIWRNDEVTIIPFSYPSQRTREALICELECFAQAFDTTLELAEEWKRKLDEIRVIAAEIDTIAVEKGCVSSFELFSSQLNLTDFNGDIAKCRENLVSLLNAVSERASLNVPVRLGVLGVPTILTDLSEVIDSAGARVVYHEVPYEYSMIKNIGSDLIDSYLNYTYPYSAEFRIAAIKQEVKKRRLDGLIHYTQSFCHRQIHDLLMRRELDIPLLTIEGDRPAQTDGRVLTRIEAFIEQLA